MALSEKYQLIRSTRISGFTHDQVQGINASLPTAPFLGGHIPEFSVVGTSTDDEVLENDTNLRKISNLHGRSYELLVEKWKGIVWSDEYGNIFSHLNIKGNNCTRPEIGKSPIAPSGYVLYGLQDSDSMVRVLRASEMLRSHHIDTEAIVKVIEPAELLYDGDLTPLPEFKKKLVAAIWEKNGEDPSNAHFTPPPREEIPQVVKALDNMTLFITVRGVQVNERLEDIAKADSFAEITTMLGNAFRYINRVEKLKAEKDTSYTPECFSLSNSEDIIRYCNEYLPKRMAANLTGFHQLGLIHYFPHAGNISTVGSFYDLDSARGEPLGDSPLTIHDITADVNKCIDGSGGFSKLGAIIQKLGGDDDVFRENFIKNYVQEMGWLGDITKFSAICSLVTGHSDSEIDKEDRRILVDPDLYEYMDLIVEQEKIKYVIDPEEYVLFILHSLQELESVKDYFTRDELLLQLTSSLKEVVEQAIIRDFIEKHQNVSLFDLASVEFFSMAFSSRLQLRSISAVNQALQTEVPNITKSDLGNLDDTTVSKSKLYTTLVKKWGWEEDIVNNIALIDHLFEGFHEKAKTPYFDYYHKKLSHQLGWGFSMEETNEDILEMFLAADQDTTREVIEKALSASFEAEDPAEVIEATLKHNETGEDFTWDHVSRHTTFGVEYVREKFNEQYGDKVEKLQEKFGEERAEIIVEWLQKKHWDRLVNYLPDTLTEKIESRAQEGIDRVKKEFVLRLP